MRDKSGGYSSGDAEMTVPAVPPGPGPGAATSKPSIGRIVRYRCSEQDAAAINKRRADATASTIKGDSTGAVVHVGNHVDAGDVFPMLIVRVWGDQPGSAAQGQVEGQVFLDGNDTFWATSVSEGDGERQYSWPPRV